MGEATRLPASVWQGTLTIFGVDLKVHVLNDGRRIIEEQSMVDLFKAMENPYHGDSRAEAESLARFVKGVGPLPEAARQHAGEGEK